MRFAACNEMFLPRPFGEAFATLRALGYEGVEIAPFTFLPEAAPFDVRHVSSQQRREVRQQAADAGLEIVGLHWLLAKTSGLYLTSPDAAIRAATAEYLRELARLCGELGGKVMVLGSPQQRDLTPGGSYGDAQQ